MKKLLGLMLAVALSQAAMAEPEKDPVSQKAGECLLNTFQDAAHRAAPAVRLHTVNARSLHFDRSADAPAPGSGRQITVRSTAYCLRGFTARGTGVEYGTVAVDPRVIPLGSRIYIPGYGWGRALDTGGAVRGNTIDLWFPSMGQCFQWGSRTVTITVMEK